MNADRINYFRSRLEDLAREIKDDLSASKDSAGIVELDTSIGRLSRMDAMQNQQMALELRRRQENAWTKVASGYAANARSLLQKSGLKHPQMS